MKSNLQLDFCIIANPFQGNSNHIIFFTRRGLDFIDETLFKEKDYPYFVQLAESLGCQETDPLTFELTHLSRFPGYQVEKVRQTLQENGLNYSEALEGKIKEEFYLLSQQMELEKNNILGELQRNPDLIESQDFLNPPTPAETAKTYYQPILSTNKEYVIPEVGEKINLHFYLFLECKFINSEECLINLNGDFFGRQNNGQRNYIQVAQSDFIRLHNANPNIIVFQSCKTYDEFLKEVDVLFNGAFEIVKPIKLKNHGTVMTSKKYVYNIMEIKKSINPTNRITIEVDRFRYFGEMIEISKRIKHEKEIENRKKFPVKFIQKEVESLSNVLSEKMQRFADEEAFEKAAQLKKDIDLIDQKIKTIKRLKREEISIKEYRKMFSLS